MPFYEYQCKNCGRELEAMQKVSDAPLKKCPHCGKSQLQRLMSAPVFRLKGAGWYETDFKDDKDKKRNLADRPEADTAKESDTKADAKEAPAKSDAKADAAGDKSSAEGSKAKDSGGEKSEKSAAKPGKPESKKANLSKRRGKTGRPPAKPRRKG